eukprot:1184837-Prorocentrum_minimum.AAC.1
MASPWERNTPTPNREGASAWDYFASPAPSPARPGGTPSSQVPAPSPPNTLRTPRLPALVTSTTLCDPQRISTLSLRKPLRSSLQQAPHQPMGSPLTTLRYPLGPLSPLMTPF